MIFLTGGKEKGEKEGTAFKDRAYIPYFYP